MFDSAVCTECVEDLCLKQIIAENGERVLCTECGNDTAPAYTAEELGKLLEAILRERIVWGEDRKVFYSQDDDKGGWEQEGDPLEYFVSEALRQDFSFQAEIVVAVFEAEGVWPPDGDQAFFDECCSYVPKRVSAHEVLEEWQSVQDELRHSRRFFSEAAKSFFASIFEEIDTLRAPSEGESGPVQVVRLLPAGSEIYRARTCNSSTTLKDIYSDPYLHAGPPPPEQARAGRMNAEGIAVLYGGLDIDTAISELRPPLDGDTMVITLATEQELRLLDFQRLESAYSIQALSYFQPDFDYQLEKHAFLRRLHTLISRPVLPGKEAEYLITQTMAEYLDHVHQPEFDGILFESVQKQGGTNIVLFAEPGGSFPVTYVDKSLKAFCTCMINYKHVERQFCKHDGVVRLFGSDNGYFDEY